MLENSSKNSKIICIFIILSLASFNLCKNIFPLKDVNQSSACKLSEFLSLLDNRFNVKVYTPTTSDGYILQVYRISLVESEFNKLSDDMKQNANRPWVLQHGLFDSSDTFFQNGEQSIGIHLALMGWDLWVPNNRGNKYSKGHVNPHISDADFYAYSYTELGLGDVPAVYNLILGEYSSEPDKKIIWQGHSQGTTQMFVALLDDSTKDLITKHTEHFFAMAPISYLTYIGSHLVDFQAKWQKLLDSLGKDIDMYEIMSNGCETNDIWDDVIGFSCAVLQFLCDPIEEIQGYDTSVDNIVAQYAITKEHNPSGTSLRSLDHYAQTMDGDAQGNPVFRKYDFGPEGNKKNYGTLTPPAWNMVNFPASVPLTMFVGTKDDWATIKNTQVITSKLTGKDYKQYTFENWNHGTFNLAQHPEKITDVTDQLSTNWNGNKKIYNLDQ